MDKEKEIEKEIEQEKLKASANILSIRTNELKSLLEKEGESSEYDFSTQLVHVLSDIQDRAGTLINMVDERSE